MKRWLLNILLAFDLFLNAVFLGDPRETISSRIGKKADRGDCKLCLFLCKWLDRLDRRHCSAAINWNEGRGSDSDDSVIGSK